jgi:hypothetical protein
VELRGVAADEDAHPQRGVQRLRVRARLGEGLAGARVGQQALAEVEPVRLGIKGQLAQAGCVKAHGGRVVAQEAHVGVTLRLVVAQLEAVAAVAPVQRQLKLSVGRSHSQAPGS